MTQSDALVSIAFSDCTAPRGLVHVTGELDLTVSVTTAGAIAVHATSSNLQVNRADLVVDATATYAVAGTDHTLTVQTSGSDTGPRGNTVDHDGSYTVARPGSAEHDRQPARRGAAARRHGTQIVSPVMT